MRRELDVLSRQPGTPSTPEPLNPCDGHGETLEGTDPSPGRKELARKTSSHTLCVCVVHSLDLLHAGKDPLVPVLLRGLFQTSPAMTEPSARRGVLGWGGLPDCHWDEASQSVTGTRRGRTYGGIWGI